MLEWLRTRSLRLLEIGIGIAPWLLSMYVFFWLDSSGTWTSETPHRGKLSVVILTTGMVLSFLVLSYFRERRKK